MTRHIAIKRKGATSAATKLLKKFLRPEDMYLVKKGNELRGKQFAYHINPYHPTTISKIHVGKIHHSMKYQIIEFIKKGHLYLRKDGIDG